MDPILLLLIFVILLTLVFDFINGFHDSANAIATVVSTRVLTPFVAVVYAGILNFIGALMGTEVAATIGSGLVESSAITLHTILCTVLAAIIWNLITWYKGLPTSSSHAIIGSLLGAAFFSSAAGHDGIHCGKLLHKVVFPMLTSPVIGIVLGFTVMTILTWMIFRMRPQRVSKVFGKLQPVHGFAAETTASIIIGSASALGIPVSTTQVITTSIMGVGATKRLSAVRWGIVGNIVWAWILTIPVTFILAGTLMVIYKAIALG